MQMENGPHYAGFPFSVESFRDSLLVLLPTIWLVTLFGASNLRQPVRNLNQANRLNDHLIELPIDHLLFERMPLDFWLFYQMWLLVMKFKIKKHFFYRKKISNSFKYAHLVSCSLLHIFSNLLADNSTMGRERERSKRLSIIYSFHNSH